MTPARARSLLRSDAGAVAPLAAVALAVVLGLAGLVVDVGVWYVQRGNLQSATDDAAMGAANELATDSVAGATAQTLLAQNGYSATNLVSTERGYYCPNAALAVADRFSTTTPCAVGDVATSSGDYNAVRLRTQTTGPALLTRVLGGTGAQITTTAVAARIDEVGLTAASGLATVNLSLANGVLGSLVGGSGLSLSLVQYNGLLNTNVDAKLFFDALAANLGVTAGTYSQLLATQVSVNQVIQASVDALNQQSSTTDVSAAVSGLQAIQAKLTGNQQIALGQLFDLGVWGDEPVGGSGPSALEAGLNAYQLATFALQLSNGAHAATVPTSGLNIPGLVSATLQATAIEPPQSAYFAFGPAGVSVHTAQVRLQLAIQVLNSTVQVPLYVEVAHGDAAVSSITCGVDPANDAVVHVQASTGIASVYIGQVAAGAMTNFSTPVTVSPAPLVSVLGVTVGAKVAVTAGSSSSTALTFIQPPATGVPANLSLTTQGYIARLASLNGPAASSGWPAQVVSTGILGGVGSGLASGLSTASLQLCVLSACSGSVGGLVGAAVATVISTVINPVLIGIDPLIDQILASLGVQLGTTEVLVSGLRCGVPVLVA